MKINKRIILVIAFLLLLLILFSLTTAANLQDTLQQKADNIQDKVDKVQQIAQTISDKESATEYLKKRWEKILEDTEIGKTIKSITSTIKTADPLFKLIIGAAFDISLYFLLTFSLWFAIFNFTRKKIAPEIGLKMKIYKKSYHNLIAFIIVSLLGGLKIIPTITNWTNTVINKIPNLFLQIFIFLFLSIIVISFSFKFRYPSQKIELEMLRQGYNQSKKEIADKSEETVKAEVKKLEEEVENSTGLTKQDKKLSPAEKAIKKGRISAAKEFLEKLGEYLEKSDEEIEQEVKKTKLDKPGKLRKPKDLY